tara:strand:- start:271 stop:1134 length:864 start_codon:yes stop_codon:yes gene_type:complete
MSSLKVSVVIPTLGEIILKDTLEHLNSGSIIPDEILLCIPKGYKLNFDYSKFDNLEVVFTEKAGQVYQRIEGFKLAKNKFVLQMDSDLFLEKYCLENLLKTIQNNHKSCVGPKLYNLKSNKYFSTCIPKDEKNFSLYDRFFFININGSEGFKPGMISKSGEPMGVMENGEFKNLDWLPGACILHQKENLILKDYYPFQGKAYAEDIYHSLELKKEGINLIRDKKAICHVDLSSSQAKNIFLYLKIIYSSLNARKLYRKKTNSSNLRFYSFMFLSFLGSLKKFMTNNG